MLLNLGVQSKTAFVLAHKLREAVTSEMKGAHVGGAGKDAEVDGGYRGGHIKPANRVENRRDRRLAENQNGKRKVVVVIRERDGRTLQVFPTEGAATGFIKARVAKGTEVMADEARSGNELHAAFPNEAYRPLQGLLSYSVLSRTLLSNFPPWTICPSPPMTRTS